MFFSPHRPVPVSRVLLLKTLISILIFTTIVTASRPHAHYDPPIPLQFSSCTQRQITTLTSELNLIQHLSASISENWENNRDSPHIRDTYNYFYTAGDSGPLYGYESTEVKRGLRRVLERMGKIQIVGLEEMGKGAVGQGEGYIRGKKYRDGLRIICKPRREADCGNSVGEGVEAFVSNGPTVRVGPELETLVVKRAVSEGMKGKRWRLGTTEVKDKASRRSRWKWLLTNGNDVQLCPLFWENKSLDVPHPLEALREIPVGDFVDYRLLTLMHELTHTHLLTGDLFLSASHENRLSLGLLDHGYGLRHPRTTETGDSSLLPRTYGERIVRNYDDSGKVLTRELKPVPYITELTRREAWANADTFVYFVFVAWQGEGASSSTTGTHGARGGGTGGRSSRRRKSRIERLEEIIKTSKHGIAIGAQRVLQRTGKGSPGTGLTALAPGENLARGCSKGREPVLEILGGSNRGRRELRRIWCRRKRIW